jgi:ankyrin repeat protein
VIGRRAFIANVGGAAVSATPRFSARVYAHDADDVSLYRIAGRHAAVTRLLETRGYRPDVIDLAAVGDADRVIVLLTSEPRAVSWRSHAGETALHAAAGPGKLTTVRALLAHGADVNAVDWRQAETRRRALVELIIRKGGRLDATNQAGETPADISRARGHTELMDLLTGKQRVTP